MTRRRPARRAFVGAVVAAASWLLSGGAVAAPPTFRIEVHALETLTPTLPQLLRGETASAPTATIAGELRLPYSTAVKVPAVLLLHGDAGALASQAGWMEELNAAGIAVLTLDSFSGRGGIATSSSLGSMPFRIGGAARVVDAERALALLARHPRIDPARIAVMGFSSGGRTVLAAAQTRFASALGTPGLRFAAYIALYPDCNVQLIDDTRTEPGPLRVFIGAADVLTDAGACRRYVERLRGDGADAAITVYADAHHAFDAVGNPDLTRIPGVESAARCNMTETSPGVIVNVDTGRELDDADRCVTKGLVAGYNAAASGAVHVAVKALLIERFGLKP